MVMDKIAVVVINTINIYQIFLDAIYMFFNIQNLESEENNILA